jgi:hypothetical protein
MSGLAAAVDQDPPAAKPWNPPPTSLPADFVQEVSFLQRHGLGDPRGGEFRRAKIARNGLTSPPEIVETRGWVLPAKAGQRLEIVTLQGLRYPALSVGERGDAVEAIEQERHKLPSAYSPPNLPVALLLIHGDTHAAEKLYLPPQKGLLGRVTMPLSSEFLPEWWNQAVAAHVSGDDALSYRVALDIFRFRDDYESEFRRKASETSPQARPEDRSRQLEYLTDAARLAGDAWRRLDAKRSKPDLDAIRRLPTPQRIDALIEALDEVSPPGIMWVDGTPSFRFHPIFEALVKEGADAMDRLLDSAEKDSRLTRTIQYDGSVFATPHVVTVRQIARHAIREYLQVYGLVDQTEDPQNLKRVREFWNRTRNMTHEERWLVVLQDDAAGPLRWALAGRSLFTRQSVRRDNESETTYRALALRASHAAELTRVLVERAKTLAAGKTDGNADVQNVAEALHFLHYLTLWNLPVAREAAPTILDEAMSTSVANRRRDPFGTAGAPMASVIDALLTARVPGIAGRYVRWLDRMGAQGSYDALAPLAYHPEIPEFRMVARRLILGTGSPWNVLTRARARKQFIGELTRGPLLAIDAVRESVFRLLDDQTVVAETIFDGFGNTLVQRGSSVQLIHSGPASSGSPIPSPGTRLEYRMADSAMVSLSSIQGAPEYRAYWPRSERDRAIAAMKRFLQQNQNQLRKRPDPLYFGL